MDHEEKMASLQLKKRKYKLWYGPTASSSSASAVCVSPSTEFSEDKEIQILRLRIRLAELTGGTSESHMKQSLLYSEGTSTPSSISAPSQVTNYSAAEDYGNGPSYAPQALDGPGMHTSNFVDAGTMNATSWSGE